MKKIIFLSMSLLFLSIISGNAQSTKPKGSFSIVTNPSYFVLGGYHIKPSYHFPKKWSVGATLQGGFDLPDFARDQFFEHNNEELIIDWRYAIGVEAKYRFSDAAFDKGLYTAMNIGYEAWETKAVGEDGFENWFASIDLGYNWYPFAKERFHVGLSYTLIFILNNTGNRRVNETDYNIRSVVPPSLIPTPLIGWRF